MLKHIKHYVQPIHNTTKHTDYIRGYTFVHVYRLEIINIQIELNTTRN